MSARRTLILAALLFAHAARAHAQTAAPQGDGEHLARVVRAVQAKLDEARARWNFPGATAGFVLPDGRSASVATGLSDLEAKTPLRPTDRMPAGSVGKTFVAAVALQLVQEKKLSLDGRLAELLGGEKWFARLPNADELTLKMLLNHSSGIPNHAEDEGFLKELFNHSARDIKREELLAYVLGKRPLFPAGMGSYYSDTNYILAGLAVEKAAGKPLYELVAERILKPLRLDATIPSNAPTLPGVANGYLKGKPVIVGGRFTVNPQWEWAGGGFASTAEDLARWASALYGGRVLRPEAVAQMQNGFGTRVHENRWGWAYGHASEFPGYLSDVRYYAYPKISVAVQVNADEPEGARQFIATAADDIAQVIVSEWRGRSVSEADAAALILLTKRWLRLLDKRRIAEGREALSVEMKAKFDAEQWRQFLDRPGKLKSRRIRHVEFYDPEAGSIFLSFESSFEKWKSVEEVIILTIEGGTWRVAAYTMGGR
ncbi:MAG TPA: serine hydrolase [Pyrinomonadaceae bacterium]|nr:serine hydrolase [Pyrinomonadaceae bacterium]